MSKFFDLKVEGYDRIYSDRELFSRIIKRFEPHSKSMTVITVSYTHLTLPTTPYV